MSSFQYFAGILLLLFSIQSFTLITTTKVEEHDKNLQIYIVHVRPPPPQHIGTIKEWHESFLLNSSRLLHSFTHALSGFSAELTPCELDHIRGLEGFVHATFSKTRTIHTTHSPSFLHLNKDPSGFWVKSANYGNGTIIGIVDTGIVPTHPSFNGARMSTPPSKWKGTCNFSGGAFPCNNKIIGGRNFMGGREIPLPPYDEHGHGTHVAGIAAGQFVQNASVLGSAKGTAAGMAPYAHLAVYKVCSREGWCTTADITAAIDMALSDGVDVISISLAGPANYLYEDHEVVAAFSAMKRGVFISMSGGNDGPFFAPVQNISPWVLTVGASTMDRRIRAIVCLGNGKKLIGESAYQPSSIPDYLPLIFPGSHQDEKGPYCTNATTLKHIGVKGKIVVCKAGYKSPIMAGRMVKEAGGAAMIFWGSEYSGHLTSAYAHEIPASYVTHSDGLIIAAYYFLTENATASIRFKGTAIGGYSDPAVATFSSRGPDDVNHGILKPDVIGPGVDVLSASVPVDQLFDMFSGTSMSCPHLAGVAALLKNSHPHWSPAMIKSAIMTTADVTNSGGHPIIDLYDNKKANFYATGAGHVNPMRANNPGLVYDIEPEGYIPYLCGLNYTDHQVQAITSIHTIFCRNYTDGANLNLNLNYPSITAFLSRATKTAQIRRTLTNVGSANATYAAHVHRPHGITVEVSPPILRFPHVGKKQSFCVKFGINATEKAHLPSEGYLIWTSFEGTIKVRSPIVVLEV